MVFIINLLFLILIICTLILALIEINTVDVLLSRSGIIANHASVIINGKIKPQKMYFQLMGYRVLGAYQGHEIIINLRQEFITVSIHISHKLGFVAQINFELGFSLTPYLSKDTLCRRSAQMSETV
jgi:hypothetical protein